MTVVVEVSDGDARVSRRGKLVIFPLLFYGMQICNAPVLHNVRKEEISFYVATLPNVGEFR